MFSKVDNFHQSWDHNRPVHDILREVEQTILDILKFILGSVAWGSNTKEVYYSLLSLKVIPFVLIPQASQPSMNFNISELVYCYLKRWPLNRGQGRNQAFFRLSPVG